MLSDSGNLHEIQPDQKGLQIKQDNKFFTRLTSRETSMANSSSTVYYGGASVAIPFDWESHPGTPKHPSSDTTLPPLAPPPLYHSSMKSKPKPMTKKSLKPSTVLGSIFRKLIFPRKNHASLPSSSWSPFHGSGSFSSFMNRKTIHRRRGHFSCLCSRSHVHNCMDDGDDDDIRLGSRASTLCFGVKAKPRNRTEFRGSQPMAKMKKALLPFVSDD
ncbi:putative Structural maintenance of chromosomes protein 1 [Hibiscus syriacus]|uniref:Structural maintenance of chromosomes protein 1 n=1 Tax=Hibiscus syriacus TaxID=106335 RepID=A0A6A3BLG8_HIBSY|nr:putative Structural maintenance of chromosomes protein 1 [Hibiscus syriacus]